MLFRRALLALTILFAACGDIHDPVEVRTEPVRYPRQVEYDALPTPDAVALWDATILWHATERWNAELDRQVDAKKLREESKRSVPTTAPRAPRTDPQYSGGSVWDRIAACESSGDWSASGGGYEGGLQFTPSTWRAYGGSGHAYDASREEQISVAERVLAGQGWGAWPVCSRKVGVR